MAETSSEAGRVTIDSTQKDEPASSEEMNEKVDVDRIV